jgi:hypothetical protein
MTAFPRPLRFRRYASYALGACALASLMISTGFCGSRGRKITVEKEVLLAAGNAARPHAIVRTVEGGFVIAGSIGNAWATRVTSSGEVVWDYWDGGRTLKNFQLNLGQFAGAVVLPDNSVLLCGSKKGPNVGDDRLGLLVRIDPSGKVLSQSSLYPNGDKEYSMSEINRCIPWNGGIALVGDTINDVGRVGWLIKLNAQGIKEWEKVGAEVGGSDALETAEHDLVVIEALRNQMMIRRLNATGDVIAARSFEGSGVLVRSIEPSTNTHLAIYTLSTMSATVVSLDRQLHDVGPKRLVDSIIFNHGCAYIYPDESFALFGFAHHSGDPYTAAIASIGSDSVQHAVYRFHPNYESLWIEDAVVLQSDTQFAVVRLSAASDDKRRGAVLSWVSIK